MRNLAYAIPLFLASTLAPSTARAGDEDRFRDSGAAWVAAVHDALHPRWKNFTELLQTLPPGTRFHDDKELSVTLELKVWPDGTVVRVEQTATSGLSGFDSAPADLLRDVERLPPPPSALRSDDGQVYLRWRFDRAPADGDRGAVIERRLPIEDAIERLVGAGSSDRAAQRVDEAISAQPERGAELLWRLARAVARRDITSDDPTLRATAARALAVLDDNEAPLLSLARDADGSVRAAALLAMGNTTPSKAMIKALVAALDGTDAAAAARAVEQLCHVEGSPEVCRGDDGATLRTAVRRALAAGRAPAETVEALRAMGDEEGARSLTEVLLHTITSRGAGARAALQLTTPALEGSLATAVMASHGDDKALVVEALGVLGPRLGAAGRTAAIRALSDDAAPVRAAAARALGAAVERRAKGRLVDLLSDRDPSVRAAAAGSLVIVGGDEAADELFRPLRDPSPSVRASLAAALVAHPIDVAPALLRRLRTDAEPAVQRAARVPAPAPAAPVAVASADDSDLRLLRAASDHDRARAAADWLCAHVKRAPAAALSTRARGNSTISVVAIVD